MPFRRMKNGGIVATFGHGDIAFGLSVDGTTMWLHQVEAGEVGRQVASVGSVDELMAGTPIVIRFDGLRGLEVFASQFTEMIEAWKARLAGAAEPTVEP